MAMTQGWRATWIMTLAVLVLIAFMACLEILTMVEMPVPLDAVVGRTLLSWLPWFVGAPLIAWIGVTFRPRARWWPAVVVMHVCGCVVILTGNHFATSWISPVRLELAPEDLEEIHAQMGPGVAELSELSELSELMPGPPLVLSPESRDAFFEGVFAEQGFATIGPDPVLAALPLVPIYAMLTIAIQALLAFGELKNRKVAEARLRAELSRSQLDALRMQVNPHFLFNTLNSVSALMATDIDRARTMLTDLSELLRSAFREVDEHESALAGELELVRKYVAIQRVRFGERLSLFVDVNSDCLGALVPSLCLQPLIENSIVHGAEQTTGPCHVRVIARRDGDLLRMEVEDDGPGNESGEICGGGVGLANTRARFAQMYGADGGVETDVPADGGFRVVLTLPYRNGFDREPIQ